MISEARLLDAHNKLVPTEIAYLSFVADLSPETRAEDTMANAVPPFDVLNRNYPNFVSVETVKRLIGGALNDLDAPPNQQWLGGANGNTCTIRLSRTLNYSASRFRRTRRACGRP